MRPGGAGEGDGELVREMLLALRHRGPDGSRVEERGGATLGHARLAIIDLETGDQPQSDESGRIRVVVNGEIYNYVELRRDLEARGHRFRTRSDVEVIPHLYRERGEAFVEDLRGMFAIALHDEERDRLVLVRDRLGQKPLYHAGTEGAFFFASELSAFERIPGLDGAVDPEALDLFFTYQYVPAPWTIRKGVRKLEAGTMLILEADGTSRIRRYWDSRPRVDEGLEGEEALAEVEELLEESSRLRLRSDVPLSLFLSGGIDSGLVAAAVAGVTKPLALTIAFPGAAEDESEGARLTAEALELPQRIRSVSMGAAETVGRVLEHMDEPHGDASCVPTWVVCREAARGFKVSLSGDGGDESFAGYEDRYTQNLAIDGLRRFLPEGVRRRLFGLLATLLPKGDGLPRFLRWKRISRSLSLQVEDAYHLDMSIVRPSLKRRLYGQDLRRSLGTFDSSLPIRRAFREAGECDLLSRLLYVDRRTWLAEGVLAKVDRMSMAHSLEVRSPLLDHRLVEAAARIPSTLKLRGGRGKRLLRELAKKRLPPDVVRAPKAGFAPPLAEWLRGDLGRLFQESVLASDARLGDLLEMNVVRELFSAHGAGKENHARPLWVLLVMETWLRRRGGKS